MTSNDLRTMRVYADKIRETIPSFDVNVSDVYGEVKIFGRKIFDTRGNSTVSVIMAYLFGMYTGIHDGHNLLADDFEKYRITIHTL